MDNFDIRKFITEKRLYEQEDIIEPDDEALDNVTTDWRDEIDMETAEKNKKYVEAEIAKRLKKIDQQSDEEDGTGWFDNALFVTKKEILNAIKQLRNDEEEYYAALEIGDGERATLEVLESAFTPLIFNILSNRGVLQSKLALKNLHQLFYGLVPTTNIENSLKRKLSK